MRWRTLLPIHDITRRADQAVPLYPLARYVYDAEGRRVERVTAQGTWDAVYDLAGRAVSEYDAADTWSRGEVWAGGRHLARMGTA